MADSKPTVVLTNNNIEKLSRKEMLEWVNTTVNGKFTKIEELCSGTVYCLMMEQIFPNSIGMKKIKKTAKMEHEILHNWRLFQAALVRLQFEKTVPIEKIMKGKFQDNFEFLQWFKKFYDTFSQANSKENLPTVNAAKPKPMNDTKPTKPARVAAVKPIEKSAPLEWTKSESLEAIAEEIENVRIERDFYHKKVVAIENLLESNKHLTWCKDALNVLHRIAMDSE